jgi:hypothetical protein
MAAPHQFRKKKGRAQMNVMSAEKPHYELGGFVQLSRRGVQHLISGIHWNEITGTWAYALDNHTLWIPEAALDLVAMERDGETQTQAQTNMSPAPDTKGEEMSPDERRNKEFLKNVAHAINYSSIEGGSNTPDWLLAEYLWDCLKVFNMAIQRRENWYGIHLGPFQGGFTRDKPSL